MSNELLMRRVGRIIEEDLPRDALHVAVAPVTAGERLTGGDRVTVEGGVAHRTQQRTELVVDPWLKDYASEGQKILVFIKPGKIKSLHHYWEHPSFPEDEKSEKTKSLLWLQSFAKGISVDYDELMENAAIYIHGDYFWTEGGRFEGVSIPEEFWDHYCVVTGTDKKPEYSNFLSCAC